MNNNTDNRNLIDRDEINLGKLFRIILMQSKLIILITLTFFLIWYFYFTISDRTYEVTSTIQVSNSSLNADRDLNSILTGGGSDTINLEEQITIGDVIINNNDYVMADIDGVVIIPENNILDILEKSELLINTESKVRKSIREGMDPQEAYIKYSAF